MNKRGPYHTRQQQRILFFLKENSRSYHTVQDVFESLKNAGEKIGHTTVYRTLEKFNDAGKVVKISGINGQPARYKYENTSNLTVKGELYCKKCGAITPLHCSEIDAFTDHLRTNHQFVLNAKDIVLYGYCETCC